MFPGHFLTETVRYSFPRARGDVPLSPKAQEFVLAFSPRTRGCSAAKIEYDQAFEVFPAHAGMFRYL